MCSFCSCSFLYWLEMSTHRSYSQQTEALCSQALVGHKPCTGDASPHWWTWSWCPRVEKAMQWKCPLRDPYCRLNMIKCHLGCPCSGQNVVKCPLFTTNTTDVPLHAAGALFNSLIHPESAGASLYVTVWLWWYDDDMTYNASLCFTTHSLTVPHFIMFYTCFVSKLIWCVSG